MTGAPRHVGVDMSDYDNDNNSGGIIGTIISLLILAAIWPYLLGLILLYVAYLMVLAIFEWIGQNPGTTVLILLGVLAISAIYHYRLIPKAWNYAIKKLKRALFPRELEEHQVDDVIPELAHRAFVPSTNLYCYWCTKKLGINPIEKGGKYYCDACSTKKSQR